MPIQRYEVGETTTGVARKANAGNECDRATPLGTGDNSKFRSGIMSAVPPAVRLVIFWVVPIEIFHGGWSL